MLPEAISEYYFQEQTVELLGTFGAFGFAFFLFLSGVKVDIGMVKRVGRKAVYLGALSVIVPMIFTLSTIFIIDHVDSQDRTSGLYLISSILSMTSFPVINCLLTDLKILNSELGRLNLSSSAIGDFVGNVPLIINILIKIVRDNSTNKVPVYYDMGYLALFVVAVVFVYRPLMSLIVRFTPEGGPVNIIFVYATLLPFFLSLNISVMFPDFSMFLVYALGLAVPPGPPLGSALVDKFEEMVSGFFLPLFVTSCSIRVEIILSRILGEMQRFGMIVILTLLVKFLACLLLLLYMRMPKMDAIVVSAISCSKGIVEVAAITLANDTKLITQDQFAFMMIMLTLLASITPALVRKLYDPTRKYVGYQRMTISESHPNSELQIIACIHVPNNVNSMINFLRVSHPTRQNPVSLNVLHLVKLRAQANPIFLSHQKGSKNVNGYWYSENVILSFKRFEGNNWGDASVKVFTAISPSDMMYDDICTLALDQLSSLVILPFHRTWFIDGLLESEDPTIRKLNLRILEKAPCSVGILIDHGSKSSRDVPSTIVVLFMGGEDDREALAFAMRMARDSNVILTVAHFIAKNDDVRVDWQTILDSEALRDVKNNDNNITSNINYEKHLVTDGRETVNIIRPMVNDYNLIIVGRNYNKKNQQTSSLGESIEFPELGILGDLLASENLAGKCSALVVQQQSLNSVSPKSNLFSLFQLDESGINLI